MASEGHTRIPPFERFSYKRLSFKRLSLKRLSRKRLSHKRLFSQPCKTRGTESACDELRTMTSLKMEISTWAVCSTPKCCASRWCCGAWHGVLCYTLVVVLGMVCCVTCLLWCLAWCVVLHTCFGLICLKLFAILHFPSTTP